MSIQSLALRLRSQSTVSLRKRMIRTSSEERGEAGELKKSATMTSFRPKLERLIQEGKIEQIMNQDPSSKAHLFYTNHVNEMQKQLASTKKSLSTLVIKSRGKDQSINTIKNEIRKVQHDIEVIAAEANAASKRFSNANDELTARKTEQELIYWREKVNAYMKEMRYKDEVHLKGRYEGLGREFAVEGQNRRLLEEKQHQLKQLNRQLRGYRTQAEAIAREQALQQNDFISAVEADMSQREWLGELKAEKHRKEGQINDIASSLIEREQLVRILEVLYAHRVLSQIVRAKSNQLMRRYEEVTGAYNFIKSNANINDPDRILKRMEEHDKLYDDALKRVNALEAHLAGLEDTLQRCTENKNQILSQQGTIHPLPAHYYQGLEHDKYELLLSEKEKLQERKTQDEVLERNILSWGHRLFERYGISESQNNNFLDCLTDLVVRIRQQK